MGYITKYKLEYRFLAHQDRFEKTMLDEIYGINGASSNGFMYEISCILKYGSHSSTWYDHESYIKSLSLKYPMVVFTLSGVGEDSGDIWRKYFCAGKMQKAKTYLTYDEFDPKKLE